VTGPTNNSEPILAGVLLAAALALGVATAADYGISIDEFNADDYGPKALAWYTSGFIDRSHFETVEFSLWYYGPWFHMLTAAVQMLDLADRFTIRHAMTFLVGLGGLAALVPIGRLAAGQWTGPTAIALCLMTGYLYGSLFFTPIDVPFLAAMTWATLTILVMSRETLPSWSSTLVTGLATGLAIATRTGGIITHAYLLGALGLCAVALFAESGRVPVRYLLQLGARYAAAVGTAWLTAVALWPWLQIGNPFKQFMIALRHFETIPMSYEFPHWGERIRTDALPALYIPEQLAARLPGAFLLLLIVALVGGALAVVTRTHDLIAKARPDGPTGLRALALIVARKRAILVVLAAAVLPIAFLIVQRATIYDGIRHVLFVIPMLAVIAGAGFSMVPPLVRRAALLFAVAAVLYVGNVVLTLASLHPLEYVAMNALAGGTNGAYNRFELDYFALAATEALRRLERRLATNSEAQSAEVPPSIVICIPWRESAVAPMLKRPWTIETDPEKADFIIATERAHCAVGPHLALIDEVKRSGRTFAWTYARSAEFK
jgi:hypothetical protein